MNETTKKELSKLPITAAFWILVLFVFNVIFPLFFLFEPLARLTLLCAAIWIALTFFCIPRLGLSRALAVGHLPWVFLVYQLFNHFLTVSFTGPTGFDLWVVATALLNLLAIVYDLLFYLRYIGGD